MSHRYTIMTASGKLVDLAAPTVEDIVLDDIAHHLSHLCRFTGAVSRFYSVAEHAILVSRLVPPGLALHALHHDDHEYVLGDVSSPLKGLLNDDGDLDNVRSTYYGLTYRWQGAIEQALGLRSLTVEEHKCIHQADLTARHIEAHELMPKAYPHTTALAVQHRGMVTGWLPHAVRAVYLHRHGELGGKV